MDDWKGFYINEKVTIELEQIWVLDIDRMKNLKKDWMKLEV